MLLKLFKKAAVSLQWSTKHICPVCLWPEERSIRQKGYRFKFANIRRRKTKCSTKETLCRRSQNKMFYRAEHFAYCLSMKERNPSV